MTSIFAFVCLEGRTLLDEDLAHHGMTIFGNAALGALQIGDLRTLWGHGRVTRDCSSSRLLLIATCLLNAQRLRRLLTRANRKRRVANSCHQSKSATSLLSKDRTIWETLRRNEDEWDATKND